jgi:multidrug efflux pump subunit AcrB
MMAAYIMRPARSLDGAPILVEPPDGPVMRAYLRVMQWCLRHRLVTAIGAGLFFVGSVSLVGLLPTTFIPPGDRGQTQVTIELAPGSTLAQTERIAEQARKEIAALPHIVGIFSSIGGGSSGDAFAPGAAAEARRAVLTISAVHRDERTESMQDIDAQIRTRMAEIPGARFNVGSPETGGKLQLVLKSEDPRAW